MHVFRPRGDGGVIRGWSSFEREEGEASQTIWLEQRGRALPLRRGHVIRALDRFSSQHPGCEPVAVGEFAPEPVRPPHAQPDQKAAAGSPRHDGDRAPPREPSQPLQGRRRSSYSGTEKARLPPSPSPSRPTSSTGETPERISIGWLGEAFRRNENTSKRL